MDRVVKEHLDKSFHSHLDLISENNIPVVENVSPTIKSYILGRYKIITGKHSFYYLIEIHDNDANVFSAKVRYDGFVETDIIHFSNNAKFEISITSDRTIIRNIPLDNRRYITTTYRDYLDKISYIQKETPDKSKNIFILFDYLDEGSEGTQDDIPEVIYDIIDNVIKTNTFTEEMHRILLENGIFGYFDKDGKLNLITFYSVFDDDDYIVYDSNYIDDDSIDEDDSINDSDDDSDDNTFITLFSKTNPGQPLTIEEQQYLIGEVEKLRQDPFNYDIVW